MVMFVSELKVTERKVKYRTRQGRVVKGVWQGRQKWSYVLKRSGKKRNKGVQCLTNQSSLNRIDFVSEKRELVYNYENQER